MQYIIDNVIDQLQKDENRRFIYVEMAFFARWWNEQEDSTRHVVKRLVDEGEAFASHCSQRILNYM